MEQHESLAQRADGGMSMLAHLTGAFGSWMVPLFGGIIGPIVIYTAKKDEVTKENARAALNFQITVALVMLVAYAAVFGFWVGMALHDSTYARGPSATDTPTPAFFAAFAATVGVIFLIQGINVVFGIIAAVKSSRGEIYRYPISLRLVR